MVYSCFEAARRQWFFLGHNDDIKSIALSQEEISYKNEVFPSGSLAATGQVCGSTQLKASKFGDR